MTEAPTRHHLARFYGELTSMDGILAGLAAAGVSTERFRAADLYERGFDCQNLGGIRHLERIVAAVAAVAMPTADDRILDVGCGLGGPARLLADRFGCQVLGVDLVPERIAVAQELTRRTGLSERVELQRAEATALPAKDASFTQVWMLDASIHVRNKNRLFREIARVLRPGGLLVLHDQVGPLPRAMGAVTRRAPYHAVPLATLMRHLEGGGLRVTSWVETTEHVLDYFRDLDRKIGPRKEGGFFVMLDAYLASFADPEGFAGLLIARRDAPGARRRPAHARSRRHRRVGIKKAGRASR